MKRVSPLKHQPETTDSDSDGKVQNAGLVLGEQNEVGKEDSRSEKPTNASTPPDGSGGKAKGLVGGSNPQALFGELEHYDLDMDEILDVPYIKSSQPMSTLPRVPHDRRSAAGSNAGGGTLERNRGLKSSALSHGEALSSSSQTPVSPTQTVYLLLHLSGQNRSDPTPHSDGCRRLLPAASPRFPPVSAVLRSVSGEVVGPAEVQVHGSGPPPPPPLPRWRRLPGGASLLWPPQLLLLHLLLL